jgi:hypothetical protein
VGVVQINLNVKQGLGKIAEKDSKGFKVSGSD